MADRLIVVPLDGSETSERALPHARLLAEATKCRLLLILVWEGADEALAGTLPAVSEELFRAGEEYYEKYLRDVGMRLMKDGGVQVDAEVLTGEAVEEILRANNDRRASYLVLSTHGRSGITKWIHGSSAGRIIREAPVPTLVVGPEVQTGDKPSVRRVMVPLDGSDLSQSALAPATQLADAFGADIVLAEVLRPAVETYMFGTPDANVVEIDQHLTQVAAEYLAKTASGLKTKGKVETRVLHGLVADTLMDVTRDEGVDLVVMASHGRGGIVRLALGSVAERMLHAPAPVMIIRPGERA